MSMLERTRRDINWKSGITERSVPEKNCVPKIMNLIEGFIRVSVFKAAREKEDFTDAFILFKEAINNDAALVIMLSVLCSLLLLFGRAWKMSFVKRKRRRKRQKLLRMRCIEAEAKHRRRQSKTTSTRRASERASAFRLGSLRLGMIGTRGSWLFRRSGTGIRRRCALALLFCLFRIGGVGSFSYDKIGGSSAHLARKLSGENFTSTLIHVSRSDRDRQLATAGFSTTGLCTINGSCILSPNYPSNCKWQ